MPMFDDREKQFEAKYMHDQELQFKVSVRRNRLLGQWAGSLLGLTGEPLAEYVKQVVESDLKEPGDNDVLRKVHGDLQAKGIEMSEHQVRKQMTEFLATAKAQINAE